MKNTIHTIYNKVGIKSDRTRNITKHVLLSFVYKGGSILASFLLVPITLNYLDTENYGIWLTLSSFIAWFSFFDIGLGNGLRNKFAEARAKDDITLAQGYVSSAYYTTGAISIGCALIFSLLNLIIDWTRVFNTSPSLHKDLSLLMPVVFAFFSLQLVVKLISTIYTADQNHSIQGKINFFTQIISLVTIWVMTKTDNNSLAVFSIIYSFIPVGILIGINFFAFNTTYKDFRPLLKLWKREYLSDLFQLGIKFFIIQIAVMVLFTTDNFIITQLFGPEEVVPYNIVFKYFSIVTMVYTIIIAPFWSSFTDAFTRKDFKWIRNAVKNIQKLWLFIPVTLGVMILISDWFYGLWIGQELIIPLKLSMSMALFVLLVTFNMIYVNFINGVGKIRVQLITALISITINIPLSIYLGKYLEWGSTGVILATCFSMLYSVILRPLQYFKIINNTAKGIWDK